MSNTIDVIEYNGSKELFLEILESNSGCAYPTALEYSLESLYRQHESGKNFADMSFHILEKSVLCASVLCFKTSETYCGFNGTGAKLIVKNKEKKSLRFLLDTLQKIATRNGLLKINVCDEGLGDTLTPLGNLAYSMSGKAAIKIRAIVELSQSEEELHANLRKSYKSLINQGREAIEFHVMNKSNIDVAEFQKFKAFHTQIAGRKTRSDDSWEVQLNMIKSGCAELSMGYMGEHGLVSSALFTDFGDTTNYAVAVYNRDLFNLPLAHTNLFDGILRAKRRGKTYFNLGVLPLNGQADPKEINIGKFKKGFTNTLQNFIEWEIQIQESGSDHVLL